MSQTLKFTCKNPRCNRQVKYTYEGGEIQMYKFSRSAGDLGAMSGAVIEEPLECKIHHKNSYKVVKFECRKCGQIIVATPEPPPTYEGDRGITGKKVTLTCDNDHTFQYKMK